MSKSLHPLKTVATPPSDASLVQSLADPAATAAFGASLAATCKGLYGGSDGSPATAYAVAIALSGDLGAGKTELARGFARAWTGDPDEEVPSPTFTLVQIYDPPDPALPSLWHFDLYRIEHPDELIALDLEDALAEAICLFEWPDRLGAYCPADHLQIALTHDAQGSGRQARVTATGPNAATLLAGLKTSLQETTAHKKSSPQEPSPGTAQMTDRLALRAAFLAEAGWADVPIRPLAADASFRSYHRLERHPEDPDARRRAVLMDAPPPQEDVRPFRDIAQHLLGLGYSAPAILAQNEVTGFLLLEDFGDATFTRLLATAKAAQRPALEEQLYQSALDLLADLHNRPAASALPKRCPAYDTAKLLEEAALLTDWYLPAVRGMDTQPDVRAEYLNAWHQVLPVLDAVPNTLVLRDFHVDNLMRLENRSGVAACGLLDFQDAVIGPLVYDPMSLLEDARRDMDPAFVARMRDHWIEALSIAVDQDALDAAWAVMAAQRHAKVAGIFTRLDRRDGKPHYLGHIPRVLRLLSNALAHPANGPVKDWFDVHFPGGLEQS